MPIFKGTILTERYVERSVEAVDLEDAISKLSRIAHEDGDWLDRDSVHEAVAQEERS